MRGEGGTVAAPESNGWIHDKSLHYCCKGLLLLQQCDTSTVCKWAESFHSLDDGQGRFGLGHAHKDTLAAQTTFVWAS